jgi:hypothetical protein
MSTSRVAELSPVLSGNLALMIAKQQNAKFWVEKRKATIAGLLGGGSR